MKFIRRKTLQKYVYLGRQKYFGGIAFIHINKCGGTSVEAALGIPQIHDTARQRIKKIGIDAWRRLYTFGIVRHPYGKVVSQYRYRARRRYPGMDDGRIPLNDWVLRAYGAKEKPYYDNRLMFAPCYEWLVGDDDEIAVGRIFKLETIDADWRVFQRETGKTVALPHKNKADGDGPHVESLSDEARRVIDAHFAADFAAFGYER